MNAIPFTQGRENAAVAVIHDAASVVAGTATAAPEPSTLLFLGCGLIGVGGVVRRRKVVGGNAAQKGSQSGKPSVPAVEEQA